MSSHVSAVDALHCREATDFSEQKTTFGNKLLLGKAVLCLAFWSPSNPQIIALRAGQGWKISWLTLNRSRDVGGFLTSKSQASPVRSSLCVKSMFGNNLWRLMPAHGL